MACQNSVTARTMSRESFIAEHVAVCTAARVKKYDRAKSNGGGLHSLEYSRRKCAKAMWRRLQRAGVTQ